MAEGKSHGPGCELDKNYCHPLQAKRAHTDPWFQKGCAVFEQGLGLTHASVINLFGVFFGWNRRRGRGQLNFGPALSSTPLIIMDSRTKRDLWVRFWIWVGLVWPWLLWGHTPLQFTIYNGYFPYRPLAGIQSISNFTRKR